jgi:hypothetical protein
MFKAIWLKARAPRATANGGVICRGAALVYLPGARLPRLAVSRLAIQFAGALTYAVAVVPTLRGLRRVNLY